MPYIITTKTPRTGRTVDRLMEPDTAHTVSRRAVATLDEAREAAVLIVQDADYAGPGAQQEMSDDASKCETLPEQGGTVGPLPDGTVIEVERVKWRALFDLSGLDSRHIHDEPGIIDAYNAQH